MSLSLFLRRLRHLNQFNTPFPSSIHRLLSTTTTPALLPNPHFSIEYLIQSCGFPAYKAIWASKKIQHLNSPDKPDAVLQFMRQTGISESDIRSSVSRDPRILCSSVENIWRPNVAKLQEVGISIKDISYIVSHCPKVFQFNFVSKVDFWMRVLGSVENLTLVLKRRAALLHSSLEKVIMPNLSFLEEQCGLSLSQIAQVIKLQPRVIISSTEALKMKAKRAQELGVACSSQMFVYALIVVSNLNQQIIDARLNNLKNLGFSKDEVTTLVCSNPSVLTITEENMGSKIQFLIKEAGCDTFHVIRNKVLLMLSLEKVQPTSKEKPEIQQPIEIPQQGSVILVDGSWDAIHGAGTGMAVYNRRGDLVYTQYGKGVAVDPFYAETEAVLQAIQYAIQRGSQGKFFIFTDNKTLVKAIQERDVHSIPSWRAAEALMECINWYHANPSRLLLQHIRREGVQTPHTMANWARRGGRSVSGTPLPCQLPPRVEYKLNPSFFKQG